MKTRQILSLIENKLSERNISGARQLLPSLVSRCKKDHKLHVRVAELLLRVPDFVKAFRLLSESKELNFEAQLLLATAANFLGASRYGLRVLESIPEAVRIKRRIETGQLLSTTYHDQEALSYFENHGTAVNPRPASDANGMRALLLRCYSLLEFQRYEEILAISRFVLKEQTSLNERAFAFVFAAWAHVERGEYVQAERRLQQFQELPGKADETWPKALYECVIGILRAKQRRWSESLYHLKLSWNLSYHPGWQPEATWFTAAYWKGWVELQKTQRFPEIWARLYAYPSVTPVFRDKIEAVCTVPMGLNLSAARVKKVREKIHIDIGYGTVLRSERLAPKVSAPEKLLSILSIAGPLGVPMFRIFDELWFEEPLSLQVHVKRLEQIVLRLRKQKIIIKWENNHLWLSPKTQVTVQITPLKHEASGSIPLALLKNQEHFSRRDVESYFCVSSRTAKRICQKWVQNKLLRIERKGSMTRYVRVLQN